MALRTKGGDKKKSKRNKQIKNFRSSAQFMRIIIQTFVALVGVWVASGWKYYWTLNFAPLDWLHMAVSRISLQMSTWDIHSLTHMKMHISIDSRFTRPFYVRTDTHIIPFHSQTLSSCNFPCFLCGIPLPMPLLLLSYIFLPHINAHI